MKYNNQKIAQMLQSAFPESSVEAVNIFASALVDERKSRPKRTRNKPLKGKYIKILLKTVEYEKRNKSTITGWLQ